MPPRGRSSLARRSPVAARPEGRTPGWQPRRPPGRAPPGARAAGVLGAVGAPRGGVDGSPQRVFDNGEDNKRHSPGD